MSRGYPARKRVNRLVKTEEEQDSASQKSRLEPQNIPEAIRRAIETPNQMTLSTQIMRSLQRTHGNHFVAGLVQRRANHTVQLKNGKKKKSGNNKTSSFNGLDPSTWTLNTLTFKNGVTRESVEQAKDGTNTLTNLSKAWLQGNSRGRAGEPIRVNVPFHTHLASGSWGLAFIYLKKDDDTVTPCVYDIAYGRKGNQYKWENGGTGYNSSASYT